MYQRTHSSMTSESKTRLRYIASRAIGLVILGLCCSSTCGVRIGSAYRSCLRNPSLAIPDEGITLARMRDVASPHPSSDLDAVATARSAWHALPRGRDAARQAPAVDSQSLETSRPEPAAVRQNHRRPSHLCNTPCPAGTSRNRAEALDDHELSPSADQTEVPPALCAEAPRQTWTERSFTGTGRGDLRDEAPKSKLWLPTNRATAISRP